MIQPGGARSPPKPDQDQERNRMSSPRDVVVIVGSLRKESFNRKMARAIAALAPPSLKFDIVEIGHLPHFNQDSEATPTAEVTAFKERIARADAVLFVTPEYNRGLPGVLKNAIDVASRPYGKSAWNGKPGAVVSVSPGAIGAFGANHHVRQTLVFLNVPAMPQPEAYLGGADKLFDAEGKIANPGTRDFLANFLATFDRWIARFAA